MAVRAKIFDPALNQLIWTLARSGLRGAAAKLKTPAGAVMTLLLGFCLLAALGPVVANIVFLRHQPGPMDQVLRSALPFMIYSVAAIAVVTGAGRAMLELRPPELQFVLAGPFTNSQILSYRLLTLLAGWIPMSAIFASFLYPQCRNFIGAFLGILTAGLFVFLIAFAITLAAEKLGELALRTIRILLLMGIAVTLLEITFRFSEGSLENFLAEIANAFDQAISARVLGFVFQPFAGLVFGTESGSKLVSMLLASGLVGGATVACYRFNGGFAELAVEGVARRASKLAQLRSGNFPSITKSKAEQKRSLPALPWLGGFGPVAWSQMSLSLRKMGALVKGLCGIGVLTAIVLAIVQIRNPALLEPSGKLPLIPISGTVASYLGFLVLISASLGFSAGPQLLTWYRVLPIHPLALAAGMITGHVLFTTGIRVALLIPAVVVSNQSPVACLAIFAAGVAFDAMVSTGVNLVCATTGLRPIPQGTPDIFHGARAILFMMVLGLALIPSILFATASVAISGALFGFDWGICAAAIAVTTPFSQIPLLWLTGWQFQSKEFE